MSSIEIRVNVGNSSYEVAKSVPSSGAFAGDRSTANALRALDEGVRDMKAAMRAGDPS